MQGMPTLIEGLLFTNECEDLTNHIASRSTFQFPKFFKLAIPQRLERTATEFLVELIWSVQVVLKKLTKSHDYRRLFSRKAPT